MVSSKGVIGTSYLASTPMSYLRLWPILRMPGSTRTGRRRSSTSAIGSWPGCALAEIVDMAERHVEPLAVLDGERQPDQLGAGDIERGRLGVDGEQAGGPGLGQQALELARSSIAR